MLEHLGLGIVLTMEDNFTPQANKAMQSMGMFENQVEVMTKNVSRAMNNLQNLMLAGFSLNTIGGDFVRGGQKILGFYKDLAGELISVNSQFDSIGASFKTVFGGMANEKLEWAMDFSIKTPFQIQDTTRAMSGLHAIGLDVTQQVKNANGELVPLLQAMGDLSTRNTGARGGIAGMMEAVSNLYGGDGGRSLRARFDLPKMYIDDLKDAVDEGGEVFAQKFADLANQLTPNAMQNMIGTWEQVVAEMQDTWQVFVWKIGKAGAFDTAKQTLMDLAGVLSKITSNEQAIQSISNVFQTLWKPIDAIAKVIGKATEALTEFTIQHPKLAQFVATGVAVGGAFMVASGAIMKMVGGIVVLGASIASLYLNFKLVKGLNLVGEFDFMFSAVKRGITSFGKFGLILGGFALAFNSRYGSMTDKGTSALNKISTAWKEVDNALNDTNSSWFKSTQYMYGNSMALSELENRYDSLTMKFTRLRLLGTILATSLFGDTTDGFLKYSSQDLEYFNTFGLMPIAQTFAIMRGRVDAFVDGVKDGIGVAIDICKSFFEIVSKPFTAFFDAFDTKLKPIGDAFKSIFGIKDLDGMDLTEAERQIEIFKQLGQVAGKLMGTLLAFKAIKTITNVITSPFVALGKHITGATNKLSKFKGTFLGTFRSKDKIRVPNTRNLPVPAVQPTNTVDKTIQPMTAKQRAFREKFMLPHRELVGDPFKNTVVDTPQQTTRTYSSRTPVSVRVDDTITRPPSTNHSLPQNVVPTTTPPTRQATQQRIPVGNVSSPKTTMKVPVSNVTPQQPNIQGVINNLTRATNNLADVTVPQSRGKSPVSNVTSSTTYDNKRTTTTTTETFNNKMYDQTQFKKIDGRFFNSKKPLDQRDWGDTKGFDAKAPKYYTDPTPTKNVPTFGEQQVKYVNVTDRQAFEARPMAQPTIMPTRTTSPKYGARGYSTDHSFIEEQGYRMSDYTNSKTRTLTTAEKTQLEQQRRTKLTSGKLGGAWNKYFKIKDRVGAFMNEYDDTPAINKQNTKFTNRNVNPTYTAPAKIKGVIGTYTPISRVPAVQPTHTTPTTQPPRVTTGGYVPNVTPTTQPNVAPKQPRGSFSRVYTAQTSDRYHNFISEAKGTNRNQTYVKNRSKLGAKLFGYQHYERDINTGDMKKVGSYGGRLRADKDDRQTRLAVEKLSGGDKYDKSSLYPYKPKPSDFLLYTDADGKNHYDTQAYKEALQRRPNLSSNVAQFSDLQRGGKQSTKLGNGYANIKGTDEVFKSNKGRLSTMLTGERYYVNKTNAQGDMYEHTVARRGGLIPTLTGNRNTMRLRDEGDVSLKGRVTNGIHKVVDPVKSTVSKYTPQIIKSTGSAISSGASNLMSGAMMMASATGARIKDSAPVKATSKAMGAVKNSKVGKAVANSKAGQLVGSAVRGVTTKEGIKNTAKKTGGFLFGKKQSYDVFERDESGRIVRDADGNKKVAGTKSVRRGGVTGLMLGNRSVDSTGAVTKRTGGVAGAVRGTAKGVGKVAGGVGKAVGGVGRMAGGAVRGAGRMAMGALSFAPMAMMGLSLGSMAVDSISAKGDGDFTEGLKVMREQAKSIDFSGMWDGMVSGAKEILPIIGDIFKNTFNSLAQDLPYILDKAWTGLKAGASLAWEWIKTDGLALAGQVATGIGDLFKVAWEWIKTDGLIIAGDMVNGLWGLFQMGWEWVKTDGLAMFTNLCAWIISDGVPLFIDGLLGIGSWLVTEGIPFAIKAIGDIIGWIVTDFVPNMITEFVSLAGSLGDAIWNGITGAFTSAKNWVSETWSGFWDGLFGKKEMEIEVTQNVTTKHVGTTGSAPTTAPSNPVSTPPAYVTGNNTSFSNSQYGIPTHHGGLWMSENEHGAVIRKDETVLPPDKSKKLDNLLDTVSTGSVNKVGNNKETVKEVGDSISIQKVEVIVKAERLSKNDAKLQAMQVIEEIKRLNKRKSLVNYVG